MRFLGIYLGGVLRLDVFVYNVYIICTVHYKTSFNPLLLGGGGVKSVVKATVNSKDENFEDFCLEFVQEFGLWYKIHEVTLELESILCGKEPPGSFYSQLYGWCSTNFIPCGLFLSYAVPIMYTAPLVLINLLYESPLRY